jgi:hypothetical protein
MNPEEPTTPMQNPETDPEDWTTGKEPMVRSVHICKRFAAKPARSSATT